MVGLAISVGAAENVHGRGSGALRLRFRDRVHLCTAGGDPPPYRIHFYLQICSDLWIVYIVCAHKPSDWATFVATARADDPPER